MNTDEMKDFVRQNRTWLFGIWLYAVIWSIALITGFFLSIFGNFPPIEGLVFDGVPFIDPFSIYLFYQAAVIGGFGGVLNTFYSLMAVISMGYRDQKYLSVVYYLTQPFIGMIFGLTVLLLVIAIFQVFGQEFGQGVNHYFILIMLCFAAGYGQRVILRPIFQFLRAINGGIREGIIR